MNDRAERLEQLSALVVECLGYRPGSGDVVAWRLAFDRLTEATREMDRALIPSDRERLAVIAAKLVVLAAQAGSHDAARTLRRQAGEQLDLVRRGEDFGVNGNFWRNGDG